MAKKIFTFKGKTIEELQSLSLVELAPLLNSAARRKIKRGFSPSEQAFLKRLVKKGDNVRTHCRDMIILPAMVNKVIAVHKGSTFEDVRITPEMIGYRLGEFVPTRKKVVHGAMGLGASRSSANAERK
ncbi:MAG TPA: ribosomal protein S19 family protein [Acidobacteriota bacterium]|nr:ribosomal protein S19 family protein [Acidobacteriota bacterium]